MTAELKRRRGSGPGEHWVRPPAKRAITKGDRLTPPGRLWRVLAAAAREYGGFKQWCATEKLLERGTYFICGDRHWQYHSIDPIGAHEFSSGAICDANSRIGRSPGDPKSTDPKGLILQPYAQKRPSGGFLSVICEPQEEERPAALRLEFFDERGKELYAATLGGS